jgi:hypothetical protein
VAFVLITGKNVCGGGLHAQLTRESDSENKEPNAFAMLIGCRQPILMAKSGPNRQMANFCPLINNVHP